MKHEHASKPPGDSLASCGYHYLKLKSPRSIHRASSVCLHRKGWYSILKKLSFNEDLSEPMENVGISSWSLFLGTIRDVKERVILSNGSSDCRVDILCSNYISTMKENLLLMCWNHIGKKGGYRL